MAHISDYSREAIESRTGNKVTTWYTIERSYGVTEVYYELLDRQQGMSTGGVVGGIVNLTATFGLVAATAINPAFAPLLAVNSTAGSIGSVLAGMGIGGAVGAKNKYCMHFSTCTGEHLGETDNEVTKAASSKGEALLNQHDYTNAREWFRIAYGASGRHEFNQAMQAIDKAKLAEECYNNGNLDEMSDHYEEACKLAPASLQHIFEHRFEQLRDLIEAARLFENAMTTWNLAWEKEEQYEVQESERLFLKAYKQCQRAVRACSTKEEYQNWLHVISLKIEGNSLFNEGYSWQDRANQSYSQELYDQALQYYNTAFEKYTEGLRRSGDQRFQDCLNIVQRQISTTQQAIDLIGKDTTKAKVNWLFEMFRTL